MRQMVALQGGLIIVTYGRHVFFDYGSSSAKNMRRQECHTGPRCLKTNQFKLTWILHVDKDIQMRLTMALPCQRRLVHFDLREGRGELVGALAACIPPSVEATQEYLDRVLEERNNSAH